MSVRRAAAMASVTRTVGSATALRGTLGKHVTPAAPLDGLVRLSFLAVVEVSVPDASANASTDTLDHRVRVSAQVGPQPHALGGVRATAWTALAVAHQMHTAQTARTRALVGLRHRVRCMESALQPAHVAVTLPRSKGSSLTHCARRAHRHMSAQAALSSATRGSEPWQGVSASARRVSLASIVDLPAHEALPLE